MKKLLSILASVGLVATASTSVVSCTKKAEMPTYHDVSDIKSWSFTSDEDLLTGKDESSLAIADVMGTVAKKFKNADEVMSKFNSDPNSFVLVPVAGTKVNQENSFTTEQFVIQRVKENDNQKEETVESASLPVTLKFSPDVDYLKPNNQEVNLDFSSDTTTFVISLKNIYQDIVNTSFNDQKDIDEYISINENAGPMMTFTDSLFNIAATQLSNKGKTLVGFETINTKQGVRFDSIKQQIVMGYNSEQSKNEQLKNGIVDWKERVVEFNRELLSEFIKDSKTGTKDVNFNYFAKTINQVLGKKFSPNDKKNILENDYVSFNASTSKPSISTNYQGEK